MIAVFATFNHIPFKKESLTMSTVTANKLKIKDILERNDKLVRSVFSTETVIVVVDGNEPHA